MQRKHQVAKRPSSECADASAKKRKVAGIEEPCVAASRRRHTLPSENLDDVVAFFELFDLGAVLLANRRLSTLAENALKRIAVTNVHSLALCNIEHRPGYVFMGAREKEEIWDAEFLQFPEELLPIALENCVIRAIVLLCNKCTETPDSSNCTRHTFRHASVKTAITHSVSVNAACFATTEDLIDYASQFPKRQVYVDDGAKFDPEAVKEFNHLNKECKITFENT